MSKPICFIIQKFGDVFYDELYDEIFEIAIKEANGLCVRADKILGTTPPLEKIRLKIGEAAVCIAEVTEDNPNVFFEVGCAFILGKPTYILWDQSKRSAKELPFDIRGQAGIPYDTSKAGWRKELRAKLVENILHVLNNRTISDESSNITIARLLDVYLSYCERTNSARTYEWYSTYIRNFLHHLGKDAEESALSLKPIQVEEWLYSQKTWGDNYTRGAITALQSAYNWAVESKHIIQNPIKHMEKPKASKRDNPMPYSDYQRILALINESDPFRDVLILMWNTDCRPEEIRFLEADYVDIERKFIRMPQGVARTGQKSRIIHINEVARDILAKLISKHPKGKLFLNSRGMPWTKYSLCNRLIRYSRKLGKSYALSDCRNGVLSIIKENSAA